MNKSWYTIGRQNLDFSWKTLRNLENIWIEYNSTMLDVTCCNKSNSEVCLFSMQDGFNFAGYLNVNTFNDWAMVHSRLLIRWQNNCSNIPSNVLPVVNWWLGDMLFSCRCFSKFGTVAELSLHKKQAVGWGCILEKMNLHLVGLTGHVWSLCRLLRGGSWVHTLEGGYELVWLNLHPD